jgi:hypothetical protein
MSVSVWKAHADEKLFQRARLTLCWPATIPANMYSADDETDNEIVGQQLKAWTREQDHWERWPWAVHGFEAMWMEVANVGHRKQVRAQERKVS